METNFEISPRFSNYIGDRMCTLLNWARLGLDTYTCTLCNYMYNCYWCCSYMIELLQAREESLVMPSGVSVDGDNYEGATVIEPEKG